MLSGSCGTRDQPYTSRTVPALSGPERDSPDWLSDIKMVKAPFGAFFVKGILRLGGLRVVGLLRIGL